MATDEGYIEGELKRFKDIYQKLDSDATMTKAMQIYFSVNPEGTYDIPVDTKTQERLIWSLIADLDYKRCGDVLEEVLKTTTSPQCVNMIVSMLPITSSSEHKNFIRHILFLNNSLVQHIDFITAMIVNSDSHKCKYMIASMLYNSMHLIERIQADDDIRQHDSIIVSTLTNISTTLANIDDDDKRKIMIPAILQGVGYKLCKDIIVSLLNYTDEDAMQDKQLIAYILDEANPNTEQTKNMICSMLPYTTFYQRKDIINKMITYSNYYQSKHMMEVLLKQTCNYQQRKEMITRICKLGCQNLDLLVTMVESMLDNSEELHHGSMIRAMLEVNPDVYFADGKFRYTLLKKVLHRMIKNLLSKHPDLSKAGKCPINPEKITGMLLDSKSDDMLLLYIADLTRRNLQSSVEDLQELPCCCAFWHMRL